MSKDNPASKPSVADGGKKPIDISDNKPLNAPTPSDQQADLPIAGRDRPVDNHGDNHVDTGTKPVETQSRSVETADKPVDSDDDKAKAKAKKEAKDDAYNTAFTQGRVARANAISKDDAPHAADSNEYKAWLKGWRSMET